MNVKVKKSPCELYLVVQDTEAETLVPFTQFYHNRLNAPHLEVGQLLQGAGFVLHHLLEDALIRRGQGVLRLGLHKSLRDRRHLVHSGVV